MLRRPNHEHGHFWLKVLLAIICSTVVGLGFVSNSASANSAESASDLISATSDGEFLLSPVFKIKFWSMMYRSAHRWPVPQLP